MNAKAGTVVLVAMLALASVARAWTDAQVHELDAEVALDAQGGANVAVTLVLEVRDGWLEQLELAGFDERLVLVADTDAVVLITETGERFAPRVQREAGGYLLTFAKERAPRRGSYRVRLRYRIEQLVDEADAEGRGLMRFVLPGWERGLRRATITFRAAQPLVAVPDDQVAQTVSEQHGESGHAVRFARVHLPRKSPWTVAVQLPSALASLPSPAREAAAPRAPNERTQAFALGALFVWLMAALARAELTRRAAGLGLRIEPRSARGHALAGLLALASVIVSAYASAAALGLLSLVPLSLAGRARPLPGASATGALEPVSQAMLVACARRLGQRVIGRLGTLDATTLLGGAGLSLLVLLVLRWLPERIELLCALPSFFLASRLRLPRDGDERLQRLAEAARECAVLGCALRLYQRPSAPGEPGDARLRVIPTRRLPGLVQLEVLADTRRAAPPLVLSAVVQVGTPSERWLARALPQAAVEQVERADGARRSVFVQPLAALDPALDALLAALMRELAHGSAESSAARSARRSATAELSV